MSTIVEKLNTIKKNSEKIYEAGQDKILDAFYQIFWDSFQEKGQRTNYGPINGNGVFSNPIWTDKTLRPRYLVQADNIHKSMAYLFRGNTSIIEPNLEKFDFGSTVNVHSMFSGCTNLKTLGELNFSLVWGINGGGSDDERGHNGYYYVFGNCTNLVSIEKIILANYYNSNFVGTFNGCKSLESITFEGEIKFSISFGDCKVLNRNSIENIVACLSDQWQTIAGNTDYPCLTLSKEAVDSAFPDYENNSEWNDLIKPKLGHWTISCL